MNQTVGKAEMGKIHDKNKWKKQTNIVCGTIRWLVKGIFEELLDDGLYLKSSFIIFTNF